MADIGDTLPNVTVQDSDGNDVKLGELSAPLILYFYPRASTPGCTTEGLDFTALSDDFAKLGVGIYGMSKDGVKKISNFKTKQNFNLTLLTDQDADATEQMGVWVEKKMYGKTHMGIERATFLIGKDGKIAKVWRKVKVKGHAQEVLEAAQEL